jgi:tetratricopeptide (TPR) repeat protein
VTACDDLAPLLAARPLGVLDEDEERALRAHLAVCPVCPLLQDEVDAVLDACVPEPCRAPSGAWHGIASRVEAERGQRARRVEVRLACAYCHGRLIRQEASYCAGCLAPHHADCFAEHGRCSAPGCGETATVRASERPLVPTPRRRASLGLVFSFSLGAAAAAGVAAWASLTALESPVPTPAPRAQAEVADPVPSRVDDEAQEPADPADPADPNQRMAALLGTARIHIADGDLAEAKAALEVALRLDPASAESWALRARLALLLGDTVRARECGERALALDPVQVQALLVLAEIGCESDAYVLRLLEVAPQLSQAWFLRGQARARRGDVEGALADARRALELDPRDPEVRRFVAGALLRLGRLEVALASCDRLLALDPADVDAYLLRAQLYEQLGRTGEALRDYMRALELSPSARGYRGRAGLHGAMGDLSAAVADLEYALELEPDHTDSWVMKGRLLAQQGDMSGALACLDGALALSPRYVQALEGRAQVRLQMGDLAAALVDLEWSLEIEPRRIEALLIRGGAYIEYRDFASARADLARAVELDPSSIRGHLLLGQVAHRRGELEFAVACFSRAIECDPGAGEAFYRRALAYYDQGRFEDALADLARAERAGGEFEAYEVAYVRGQCAYAREDWSTAQAAYARFLEEAPPGHLGSGRIWEREAECRRRLAGPEDDSQEVHTEVFVAQFDSVEDVRGRLWLSLDRGARRVILPREVFDDPECVLHVIESGTNLRVLVRDGHLVEVTRLASFMDEDVLRVIDASLSGDEVVINGIQHLYLGRGLASLRARPTDGRGSYQGEVRIDLVDVRSFVNPAAERRRRGGGRR